MGEQIELGKVLLRQIVPIRAPEQAVRAAFEKFLPEGPVALWGGGLFLVLNEKTISGLVSGAGACYRAWRMPVW